MFCEVLRYINIISLYPYTTNFLKILFSSKVLKIRKALQQNAKGLEMSWLPRQNDYRTFCMSNEAERVYQKLEEVINTC